MRHTENILTDFFRTHWRAYASALLMLAAIALMNLSIPWITGKTVDAIVDGSLQSPTLLHAILLLLGIGIAVYGLRYCWRVVLYGASYYFGVQLRARYYTRLMRMGPAFYQRHNTGDLMARATNDIDAVEMAVGEGVLSGFDGLMILVLVLIMMFVMIDWRLAAVVLLPFPVMMWLFKRISAAMQKQFDVALQKFSALNDRTQEALSGIRLMKAMGREQHEVAAFNRIADEAAAANFRVQKIEAQYDPVIFLVLATALLLTLGCGGWLVSRGELTVGKLTSFTMYLGQLVWPMFALGWLMNIVQRGRVALRRVNEILDEADDLPDNGSATLPIERDLHVAISAFTYPGQAQAALHNIVLDIPAGKTLGIVGPTGSGKSTLLHVLMRHYDCSTANIRIHDTPLHELPLQQMRSVFAWVPQDAFLFSATLAENIALAAPHASEIEIANAARLASLDDDIRRLPHGFATLIGERGITLSGGQRQRVAIARALLQTQDNTQHSHLQGNAILVLDDALSAVDVQTEKNILQHLRQSRHQRSCIIVSHRLSAVADADEIVVLSHGTVRERGTHAELLAEQGWYARMWAYQQLESELEAEMHPENNTAGDAHAGH